MRQEDDLGLLNALRDGMPRMGLEFRWSTGSPTFTAYVIPQEGEPALELELRNNDLRAVGVVIRKKEGVTSRDIRLPLDSLIEWIESEVRKSNVAIPLGGSKRRVLDDDFLRAVVEAYVAAGRSVSGISPDADARFDVSYSQKHRWLKAARERGLLDDGGDE